MEIKNPDVAWLSNHEVMTHLQNIKDKKGQRKGQLATITYEALKYLDSSPCSQQTSESIKNFLKDLKPFNLSKMEKLMIVNNPPTSPLEIQLLVEESEEKLTDSQVNEILEIVEKHFTIVKKEPELDP